MKDQEEITMAKIGFIGMGNMAGAIMRGSLRTFAPEDIIFFDANKAQAEKVTAETGVQHVSSNIELVNQVKYIILAVKPQVLPAVMAEIKGLVKPEQVVISIAAGFGIADLTEGIGTEPRYVRVMPNTPALVGEGMSGVAYDAAKFNDEEKAMVETIFTSIGKMELVNENMMDAVASASGCSPAYVYMFIEALADGCVKNGLPRALAYKMVAQAVLGSAKMVLETGMHPGELKDMVCSPGGTTIEGLAALEENNFRGAIIKACDANFQKNKLLK